MKTVLVTGANRGIGLEICRAFGARGDRVIGVCRKPSRALEALGHRVESGVDVCDPLSLAAFRDSLGNTTLNVLVNNAGVLEKQSLGGIDTAGIESMRRQYETNSLGPLMVTQTLLGNLKPGSKVAIVTSRMGSMADNTFGGHYGYRMSKAAVNAAGVSLARDLEDHGIPVILLHPG